MSDHDGPDGAAGGDDAPAMSRPRATRIMDRGYRRYDGERGGVREAMRSVWRYTLQRILGIHRLFRFKVLPILMIGIAYVPTLVYVGITVITNQVATKGGNLIDSRTLASPLIIDYSVSYTGIVAAIVLFAAFVAPEVLCTDRRTGMLGLYLASPLNRWSYLASKAAAVFSVLMVVTLGPPLLLLLGYSTQGFGPSGIGAWLRTLGRIVATGLAIGGFHTMLSLATSSITSRRAAASGAFVALVVGTGSVVPLLVNGGASVSLGAFDLWRLPQEVAYRIFGEAPTLRCIADEFSARCEAMSTPWGYGAFAAWMLLSLALGVQRYRRIEVTK